MSEGVLRLAPIVARIQAECPGLREVGDAEAYVRLSEAKIRPPSAWVLPLADRGGPNRYADDQTGQEITAQFAVVMAARDIRRDRGSQALSELEETRIAVRAALRGFVPDGCDSQCLYSAGRLVTGIGRDGLLFWQEDWSVTLDFRSTA